MILLPTAYLGSIYYYSRFLMNEKNEILIEQHDNYPRQTYRNRCLIYDANGVLTLSVPVKKPNGNHTKVKDVLVDYDTPWQKDHLGAITSAYRSAPFFEYFFDDIEPFYRVKTKFLIELNRKLTNLILDHLRIPENYSFTEKFVDPIPYNQTDYRERIHPKKAPSPGDDFNFEPYHQVFSNKFGFKKNLSIIDLLFNLGQESRLYLKNNLI